MLAYGFGAGGGAGAKARAALGESLAKGTGGKEVCVIRAFGFVDIGV